MTTTGLLLLGARPLHYLTRVAAIAEHAGVRDVWIADERFYRDPYVAATCIANATETIGIGPCVTDPYMRHPVVTAAALASLDEISSGRAVLGLGPGISGFREVGLIREPPPVSAVGAAISTVRELLRGSRLTGGAALEFHPFRSSIPIHVAAEGASMLRLAGQVADGVILQAAVQPEVYSEMISTVGRAAQSAGRDCSAVEVTLRLDVALGSTVRSARNAARAVAVRRLISKSRRRRLAAAGVEVPEEVVNRIDTRGYTHDRAFLEETGHMLPHHVVDALTIATTCDEFGRRLNQVAARGVDRILIAPVIAGSEDFDPVVSIATLAGAWERSFSNQVRHATATTRMRGR